MRPRASNRSTPSTLATSRANSCSPASRPSIESEIALQRYSGFRIQDIDLSGALGFVAPPDLEIVEIVRGRYLDRPGSLFRIGIRIADDCDEPSDERQPNLLSDQMLKTRIFGMDRDGAVAKHRLRPRCRDGQYLSSRLAALVDDGIIEVIEMPVRVLRQGLAERRLVQAAGRRRATI